LAIVAFNLKKMLVASLFEILLAKIEGIEVAVFALTDEQRRLLANYRLVTE